VRLLRSRLPFRGLTLTPPVGLVTLGSHGWSYEVLAGQHASLLSPVWTKDDVKRYGSDRRLGERTVVHRRGRGSAAVGPRLGRIEVASRGGRPVQRDERANADARRRVVWPRLSGIRAGRADAAAAIAVAIVASCVLAGLLATVTGVVSSAPATGISTGASPLRAAAITGCADEWRPSSLDREPTSATMAGGSGAGGCARQACPSGHPAAASGGARAEAIALDTPKRGFQQPLTARSARSGSAGKSYQPCRPRPSRAAYGPPSTDAVVGDAWLMVAPRATAAVPHGALGRPDLVCRQPGTRPG
jgi:hypothetical protein